MEKPYRDGVVAVVTANHKEFWVGERRSQKGAWQFPQGGIDPGETPEEAVLRELSEEMGINRSGSIIRQSRDWIYYDFPPDLRIPITENYRGQKQIWFLIEVSAQLKPNLAASDGEFRDTAIWKIPKILDTVIYWKRDCYRQGLHSLGLDNA